MSQAIIRANTTNIALYNNYDTALCAYFGSYEYMLPDYSTLKSYQSLSNCYATLVDTTRLPIEEVGTAVYTLNGRTIITHNAIYIPSLRGPL